MSGGVGNMTPGELDLVVGGANNTADSAGATGAVVVGGEGNNANAGTSVVVGGRGNTTQEIVSVISGGRANQTSPGAYWAVVSGSSEEVATNSSEHLPRGGGPPTTHHHQDRSRASALCDGPDESRLTDPRATSRGRLWCVRTRDGSLRTVPKTVPPRMALCITRCESEGRERMCLSLYLRD